MVATISVPSVILVNEGITNREGTPLLTAMCQEHGRRTANFAGECPLCRSEVDAYNRHVRALNEGERRRRQDLAELCLPAPHWMPDQPTLCWRHNRLYAECVAQYDSGVMGAIELAAMPVKPEPARCGKCGNPVAIEGFCGPCVRRRRSTNRSCGIC